MAERCADPANAKKLRVLEQLERETKEVLRPAVKDFGWPGVEGAEHVKAGEELGAKLAPVPWAMLMVGLKKELEGFVAQFEQAEPLAPPGREALFRLVTDHERALLAFVEREIAGAAADDALAPIVAILGTVEEMDESFPKGCRPAAPLGNNSPIHHRRRGAHGAHGCRGLLEQLEQRVGEGVAHLRVAGVVHVQVVDEVGAVVEQRVDVDETDRLARRRRASRPRS